MARTHQAAFWTREEFAAWLSRMGFTQLAAGQAIGRAERTIQKYVLGEVAVDKTTALACMQVERGQRARK